MVSPDAGWKILLSVSILLRRIVILPKVVLWLIKTQNFEDVLHGFIADGLLGCSLDGLPGHADSHSFWGGGHQLRLQPHGLKIRDRIFRGARVT